MTRPAPPGELAVPAAAATERLGPVPGAVPAEMVQYLDHENIEALASAEALAAAARDWWPIAIGWAARGQVPALPQLVVRPRTADEVSRVVEQCSRHRVPVTPAAGRSGVCGGAVPLFGGVALDCTALDGEVVVDRESLLADVPAGLFGPDLEAALRATGGGYTLGHWPQSMTLSTVGGWLACRGAGQYSTRYGKVEDMVVGLEVVLADGTVVRTEGRAPRAATGPNLTQLFVGSEGVLGVITKARLRIRPLPPAERRAAFGFATFAQGLDTCRRILRRGATPAVLRLYDATESERNFGRGDTNLLVVLDEGDGMLVDATMAVVEAECQRPAGDGPAAQPLGDELVQHWLEHRNDVSALVPLWQAGVVVDTAEVAGRWSVLAPLAEEVTGALGALEGTLAASVHQSHAYPDGACLYFTFGGKDPGAPLVANEPLVQRAADGQALGWEESYYVRAWETVTEIVERHGAAISHHHGIGLNRGRFLCRGLGAEAFGVLQSLKRALDPQGILNPGKLGLDSPWGTPPWP